MYSEAEFWHDVHDAESKYERGDIDKDSHDNLIQQYLEWFEKTNKSKANKIRKARGL